jgi:hypothetical protein
MQMAGRVSTLSRLSLVNATTRTPPFHLSPHSPWTPPHLPRAIPLANMTTLTATMTRTTTMTMTLSPLMSIPIHRPMRMTSQ